MGGLAAGAQATGQVDTDSGIDVAISTYQRRRDTARNTIVARLEFTHKPPCDMNEFFVGHCDSTCRWSLRS